MNIDWKNLVAGNPRTYTINDLDELTKSKKLYARKFDTDIDKKIILELRDTNKNNFKW